MISKIHVKGYQSLEDVKLELGKFTVIVGQSDSGKSALIRAIDGWARNQSGSDFTTHSKHSTTVTIELADGNIIVWKKPSNSYIVNDKEFSKSGRECPSEVKQITGFIDVVFDEDYSTLLNIANQFDVPFLVSLSGSKVAKVVGKISGIEFLYNAQRLVNKAVLGAKSEISSIEHLLHTLKIQMESFTGLDLVRENLDEALLKIGSARGFLTIASELESLLVSLEDSFSREKFYQDSLDSLPDVDRINFDSFDLSINRINDATEILVQLSSSDDEIDSLEGQIIATDSLYQSVSSELEDFWSELSVCPLCEQQIEHKPHE